MNDYSQERLEASRPTISASEAVNYCLEQLYNDEEHGTGDYISPFLTFEELIGALLLARGVIEEADELRERLAEFDEDYAQ